MMKARALVAVSLCAAAIASGPARARGAGRAIALRDGARLRQLARTGARRLGLDEVRFADAASGRAARAFVGRRALVRVSGAIDWAALGVRPLRALLPALGTWLVESAAPDEEGLELAARLQRDPRFGHALVEALPDLYFARRRTELQLPPDDPRYPGQWFFPLLQMEEAWAIESGQPSVDLAILDNGCDLAHPDLVDKLDPGHDSLDGSTEGAATPDTSGNHHGTACAGLAAAATGNGLGVAGACPGCRLRCVRLLDASGQGLIPISADVDAFQFVLDSGAAVASNSWGFSEPTPVPQPLADAIALVHEQGRGGLGALVVFAAGNDNRTLGDDELEALPGVITVGAVDNFGELAQFSNVGAPVRVVAPTGTLTTDISGADGADPGDYTSTFGGTSSACPIVAGILGLMVSAAPDKTASELEEILRVTAQQSLFATPDASGHDDGYGYGLVQPADALRMLVPAPPPKSSSGCDFAAGGAPPLGVLFLLALLVLASSVLSTAKRVREGSR